MRVSPKTDIAAMQRCALHIFAYPNADAVADVSTGVCAGAGAGVGLSRCLVLV